MRPLLLVLTVIQNAKTRSFARMVLEGAGHRIIEAAGEGQAYSLLSNGLDPDLLLCEVSPQDHSENAEYREFLKYIPAEGICLITKMSDQELRSQASALGIKRFLAKPVTREDLESAVESLNIRADTERSLKIKRKSSKWAPHVQPPVPGIPEDMPAVPFWKNLGGNNFFLAASPRMLEIYRQVKLLADIDVNVLILGESGTGKEVIAQLIHRNSRRSARNF